jgi:hypothetical protein
MVNMNRTQGNKDKRQQNAPGEPREGEREENAGTAPSYGLMVINVMK